MPQQTQQLKAALETCTRYVKEAILPSNSESSIAEAERIIWLMYREIPGPADALREYGFVQFVSKIVDAERKKAARTRARSNPAQMHLPGFEALPTHIEVFNRTVPIREATYRQVREFLSQLVQSYRQEAEKDPLMIQTRQLLRRMKTYPKRTMGTTVAQVLGI